MDMATTSLRMPASTAIARMRGGVNAATVILINISSLASSSPTCHAQDWLPAGQGIHSTYSVTHPVAEAVKQGTLDGDFLRSFASRPDEASRHLRAQLAIAVWYSRDAINEDDARVFIFQSLRAAIDAAPEPSLLTPSGSPMTARAALDAYAFTFQMTKEEIDAWWTAVGRRTTRDEWPRIHVEAWLKRGDDAMRTRRLALLFITRNIDAVASDDIRVFEEWWRQARTVDRDEWPVILIDRAMRYLADGPPPGVSYGQVKDQLLFLVPRAVAVGHGVGLPVNHTLEQRDAYNARPLSSANLTAFRRWWEKNRAGYRVPADSKFREPDSPQPSEANGSPEAKG